MKKHLLPKFVIATVTTLCVFFSQGQLFAQNKSAKPLVDNLASDLHEQAQRYREAGLEYQRIGNLAAAMSLYQKAIVVDPSYAVAYNDLGVIYEAQGNPQRAEESYLKAIRIDPNYLSAYTNLALCYENQRNLEKAAYYWAKRAGLGSLDDPWTQKAISRFKDIRLVLSSKPISDAQEEEVLGLMKDISVYKSTLNKNNRTLAQDHFLKAKQNYQKGDLAAAIKEALDAQYLDQDNPEIEAFIENTESRALLR